MLDTSFDQLLNKFRGQLRVGGCQQFASLRIDDVVRENLTLEVLARYSQFVDGRFRHVTNMLRRDALALFDDELAAQLDIEGRGFAAQALRHETHLDLFVGK